MCGNSVFTYHIYDLYEAEAQFNGEILRVVGDWSLQRVVVSHQVLEQPALAWPLKRNCRRQRNLNMKYFLNLLRQNVSTTQTVSHIRCQFLVNYIGELPLTKTSCSANNPFSTLNGA